MIRPEISRKHVIQAAKDVHIKSPEQAADIIRLMVELRSNSEIVEYMKHFYGQKWYGTTLKMKFITLLQSYILYNYFEDFREHCKINGISIFNEDLDVRKAEATYARFIFVNFLRENLIIRKTLDIKVS